jgi:hypothetical protein
MRTSHLPFRVSYKNYDLLNVRAITIVDSVIIFWLAYMTNSQICSRSGLVVARA